MPQNPKQNSNILVRVEKLGSLWELTGGSSEGKQEEIRGLGKVLGKTREIESN